MRLPVLNQRDVTNDSRDHQLLDRFIFSASPCNPEQQRVSTDLEKLASRDPENVIGAYGFLEWLPGNRSLVDVSGSANLWGVSFSDALGENDSVLSESLGYPARKVSQVINDVFNQNFFDYINTYRIREAEHQLRNSPGPKSRSRTHFP